MIGFNGALLGPRRVPTTSSASGLWIPDEQVLAQRAGIWPRSGGDPFWAQTKLLLPLNATTGLSDLSPQSVISTNYNQNLPVGFPAASGPNAPVSTAAEFVYPQSVIVSYGSWLDFSTSSPKTFECFFRPTSIGTDVLLLMYCGLYGVTEIAYVGYNSTGIQVGYGAPGNAFFRADATIAAGSWHYVAVTSSPATGFAVWFGQVGAGNSATLIGTNANSWYRSHSYPATLASAVHNNLVSWTPCQLSNVRMTDAIRYSNTFAIPQVPFPNF